MPKARYVDPGNPAAGARTMKAWQKSGGVNTNSLIMSAPKFHYIKTSVSAPTKRQGASGGEAARREIAREEYLAHLRDEGSDWNEESSPYEYRVWRPDGSYDHYTWAVDIHRPTQHWYDWLNPMKDLSGNNNANPRAYNHFYAQSGYATRPAGPYRPPPPAHTHPANVADSGPGGGGYVPSVSRREWPASKSGSSNIYPRPASFVPYSSKNRSSYKSRSRRPLRLSDLTSREKRCVIDKIGVTRFLAMGYDAQMSTLRRYGCLSY